MFYARKGKHSRVGILCIQYVHLVLLCAAAEKILKSEMRRKY